MFPGDLADREKWSASGPSALVPLEGDRPSKTFYDNTQRMCCVSSDQQLPPTLV